MDRWIGGARGEPGLGLRDPRSSPFDPVGPVRSLTPSEAARIATSDRPLLDLRTRLERWAFGAPEHSIKVSVLRHALRPEVDMVYLCQHALRSKLPAARGAREVAGGFRRWKQDGVGATPPHVPYDPG